MNAHAQSASQRVLGYPSWSSLSLVLQHLKGWDVLSVVPSQSQKCMNLLLCLCVLSISDLLKLVILHLQDVLPYDMSCESNAFKTYQVF